MATVDWTNIPWELLERNQWVLWRYVVREDRPTKVPFQPNGKTAKSSDASTWSPFSAVREKFDRGGFDGIGFCLSAEDEYVGIDLDHVIDTTTGEIAAWALDVIEALDSYTEATPGGDGLRVWIRASRDIPLPRKRATVEGDQQIEIYRDGRYFTVTGRRWGDSPSDIQERDEALRAVCARYLSPREDAETSAPAAAPSATPSDLSDVDLINRIRSSKQGADFSRLWAGNAGGDDSANDLALCNILAFWCGPDAGRIDRLFRQSGLCRPKWDKRHNSAGQTYGAMTIGRALADRTEWYTPFSGGGKRSLTQACGDEEGGEQHVGSIPDPDEPTDDDAPLVLVPGEVISNSRQQWIQIEKGSKSVYHARRAEEISRDIVRITDGWPRICDGAMFTARDEAVMWLSKPSALFAWIHRHTQLSWREGQDYTGLTYVGREEMYNYLLQTCEQYEAVEMCPHEPNLPGHYYLWRPDPEYTPDGQYFDQLVSFFDNYETLYDKYLIRAMFLTPGWGGPPGRRPAFAITAPDSGCGKSTLADMVGRLYGGAIDVQKARAGGSNEELLSRLLTPESRSIRVVRSDNVKGELNDQQVEMLITTPTISGRQLYKGEGQRPNTLTWIITGNGLRLSRDIANRCFMINLTRPRQFRASWESEIVQFLERHRRRILMDIVHVLGTPAPEVEDNDRWSEWVSGVLAHCTTATYPLLCETAERRSYHDADAEEATLIYDAVCHLSDQRTEYYGDGWRFVSRAIAVEVANDALGTRLSTRAMLSVIRQHITSGRLQHRMMEARTPHARGFSFAPHIDEGAE